METYYSEFFEKTYMSFVCKFESATMSDILLVINSKLLLLQFFTLAFVQSSIWFKQSANT